MKKSRSLPVVILLTTALILAISCSNSKDSGTNSNGGGNREFVSGDLNPGQSFTHVFKTAKTIPYFCRYHSGMRGTITVQAGGTPSKLAISITAGSLPTFTIDVNDTVTWTNNHNMKHTVESDD